MGNATGHDAGHSGDFPVMVDDHNRVQPEVISLPSFGQHAWAASYEVCELDSNKIDDQYSRYRWLFAGDPSF